jgi:hypothetical protein
MMEPFDSFALSIPRKLVPARRCECGLRVPEEEAVWHAEELRQMESAYHDSVAFEYGNVLGTDAEHSLGDILAEMERVAMRAGWDPIQEPLWLFAVRHMERK